MVASPYPGLAAVRDRAESYMDVAGWDGRFRELEYVDAGEEVVVVWRGAVTPLAASGETIPVEMDLTVAQVFLFEDGKVRRCRQYLRKEEALEAAGLSQ